MLRTPCAEMSLYTGSCQEQEGRVHQRKEVGFGDKVPNPVQPVVRVKSSHEAVASSWVAKLYTRQELHGSLALALMVYGIGTPCTVHEAMGQHSIKAPAPWPVSHRQHLPPASPDRRV